MKILFPLAAMACLLAACSATIPPPVDVRGPTPVIVGPPSPAGTVISYPKAN